MGGLLEFVGLGPVKKESAPGDGINWNADFINPARQAFNATQKPQGFLGSMMPGALDPHPTLSFLREDKASMPAAPPPQWAYDPNTKTTGWGTPERKGSTTEFEMKNNAPGTEGFTAFKGNRI